jgi:hypothetical protein
MGTLVFMYYLYLVVLQLQFRESVLRAGTASKQMLERYDCFL